MKKKLTPNHYKNSQLHALPEKDPKLKHVVHLDCPCDPTFETINGNLVVTHNMVGKGKDKWVCRTLNLGVKYKLK